MKWPWSRRNTAALIVSLAVAWVLIRAVFDALGPYGLIAGPLVAELVGFVPVLLVFYLLGDFTVSDREKGDRD